MQGLEKFLKQKEVAEVLGVTSPTVRKLRKDGKLKGYKVGERVVMYNPTDVKKLIKNSQC